MQLHTAPRTPLARRLQENLRAYHRLDYTPSGSTPDASGNGHTLTDVGTVTAVAGPSARIPYATQFTAVNVESMNAADTVLLSVTTRMTLAGWVYFDSDTFATVNSKWNTVGDQRSWYLQRQVASDAIDFAVDADGIAGAATVVSSGATSLATWYFVVCYYDGVNIGISLNNGAFTTAAFSTDIFDGNGDYDFGLAKVGGAAMDGRLASWGLWGRVLSDPEITYLYNGGTGRDLIPSSGFV